ncbi:unnamed protein product [Thelazia callipaeda]|uniref:PRA1 family protein n=1 Tax=Thelazia callipaeda TaxID=103827 RepID=A0A0N5D523_THECL|nr:unnamed protein product [Thelazia callipaeda]
MSESVEEARDAQCATNFRAFDDIRAWSKAVVPWSDFFRFSQFALPRCIHGYIKRVKKNLSRFLANYAVISVIVLLCCIITSFWLMVSCIVLGIFVYAIYRKTKYGPIRVGTEEIPTWILHIAAIFITLPLFIYAGVGYILYCAIGLLCIQILHINVFSEIRYLPEENIEIVTELNNQPRLENDKPRIGNDKPRLGTVEVLESTSSTNSFSPKTRVRFSDDSSSTDH